MGRFSRACPYAKRNRAEAQRRDEARGAQGRRAAAPADGGHGNAAGLRARASGRVHRQRRGALDAIGGRGRAREAAGRLHGAVSRDHRRCLACANDQDGLPPEPMRRQGRGGENMEFGVFDHLDRCGGALADYYEDRLKIAEAYDRAGFYAYHLAEPHATPLGMAPSPSVFLAAVAQRTTRLRFGPLVWPMPLHHPLRLIEEICMLDQLSGGRLELGFGRGAAPIELEYYGVDPQDAQEIYAEAV